MPLRSFTTAEVVLTGRRRFEYPLMILVWLGVLSFSVAEGTWFYFLAGTAAVGVNLWAVRRRKEVYVGRLLVNVAVCLATLILLLEVFSIGLSPLVALGHYLILIQLCKLFERKSNRDYVQLLVLSLLLLVASSLISANYVSAILMLTHLALASYTTMVFTLKRSLDAAAEATLASETGPLAPQRVAWNVIRAWPGRALRRRLGHVMIGILAGGVVMFLVTPRTSAQRQAGPGQGGWSVSGFGEVIRLGEVSEIYLSDAVAMRVRMQMDDGSDFVPKSGVYLRGKIFDRYSRSRWLKSGDGEPRRSPAVGPPGGARVVQQVSMSRSLQPTVFAMHPLVLIKADGRVRFLANGEIVSSPTIQSGNIVRYTAFSWARPLTEQQLRYLRQAQLAAGEPAMATVETTPRLRQLARDLCEDLLDKRRRNPARRDELDIAIARRIADHLRRRYEYSLRLKPKKPDDDANDYFLFDMKRGHCEYFASALTAMCSSLDIRVRWVAGFHVDPSSRRGDTYVVRQRDAHAWTEVYTPSTDWVIVDATPSGGRGAESSTWSWWRDFWKNLEFLWDENVAGYDSTIQRRLLDGVVGFFRSSWRVVADTARAIRRSMVNFLASGDVDRVMVRFMAGIGALGGLIGGILLIRLARRHVRRRRRSNAGLALEHIRFVRRLFALLEAHGYRIVPAQTPMEAAGAAAKTLNLPKDTLASLVELYYRLRWGRCRPEQSQIHGAEQQVADLAKTLTGRK